ncbi:MAG TPA: ATP-binding protein [Gemmatimonadales bacterium]|nr:ATP-binding protein [Gemmatimonadales bacterium]
MRHLARWWMVLVLLDGLVAVEWLRRPAPLWVALAWLGGGLAALAVRPWRGWRRPAVALALAALALGLTAAQAQLRTIETDWTAEREHLVKVASSTLNDQLHAAYHAVAHLAEEGAAAADGDRETAFRRLGRAVPTQGPEMGVTIVGRAGLPWAWAGRQRLDPLARGDSVAVRTTGYYVVLEARRQSPSGRIAVASLLIWAHPVVPERARSLTELVRRQTDVTLQVYQPGQAPSDPDVFAYREPTPAGARALLSVLPIPPEQGAEKELALERGTRAVTWLLLLVLALAFALARRPLERYLVLAFVLFLAVRAPPGVALGARALFSPATYFRPLLGPLSSSAGVLALTGFVLTLAGVGLWRRRPARRWYGVAAGVVLVLAAPWLVTALARGITPPAGGAPPGLWLTWELTLVFAMSAPMAAAAALFRAGAAAPPASSRVWTGVGIAVLAAVVGVFVWSPEGGWPEWYLFLWAPALILVALPAPRAATIAGIGIVAGSAAALSTWGAELSGRLQVAQRDIARLGEEPDPFAVPLLESFGDVVRSGHPPATASELYALWGGSELSDQGYPAHLALWSDSGALREELPLDSLDLPLPLVSSLVRGLAPGMKQAVTPLRRIPGVTYVLVVRAGPDNVLSVGVGPRSRLVAPGRLGRLLDPERRGSSQYRLTLSPPAPELDVGQAPLTWRREDWYLRSEHNLAFPGGARQVHAEIDLRGPLPLFVRGLLVVLFDAGLLALVWALAEFVSGGPLPRLHLKSLSRSFRFRLAVTLATFFIVPAVGFSGWGFARLAAEAERGRDLLITQTLRDALLGSAGLEHAGPEELESRLGDVSRRIDADLAFYRGGALVATSAPVLQDLGVVGRLMDPAAFRALALGGQLELTRAGPMPELGERIGFRVVQPGPPSTVGVIATPQLAGDSNLGAKQLDLALVLLLATIAGVAAALVGARRVARALTRPVSELRRSAVALGKGLPMPAHSAHPPLEFEPVFGAFERMAADISASQTALEEARRRTATVLATVATGVVALDPNGHVLIANRQAVDLLGMRLGEGDAFLKGLSAEWVLLADAVRDFLAAPAAADAGAELTVGGRRYTVQLASLGSDVRGAVLALSDVTDLSRAERVLAWGEMARQVAHEIKNPLTPMRLGMQHLTRVWRDQQADFDRTLEETSARILREIDRLDTIARAFSRFSAPAGVPAVHEPLERLDLTVVAQEVVELYRLAGAGSGAAVELTTDGAAWGAARRDEVKEVLVNLIENARNAGAATIRVAVAPGCLRVHDDGDGIAAHLLPRIFEPRFSTTTSGSGLGLSIVRRLVESWGGTVEVESEAGRGTTVTVRLEPAPEPAAPAGAASDA